MIEIEADFGFGILPRDVMRSSLSITSKAIYAYLISFAGNTKKAYPSVKLICSELKISKDTFYKYLKELQEFRVVKIEKERDAGKFTKNVYILSPCPKSSDTAPPDTVNQDTNNNNTNNNNTNIKEKNIKKEKYFDDVSVNEIFNEFLELRKKLKAVNSDRAINLLINKLEPYPNDTKIKMIEKSIESSWKGIYELKQPFTNKKVLDKPSWLDKQQEAEHDPGLQKELETIMSEYK